MNEATLDSVRPNIDDLIGEALAHISRSALDQAEQILLASLTVVPEHAAALQLLGVVRRMQGNLTEAEDLYRRSLAINPAQPQVHHNLGNLLRSTGRHEDAAIEQREAIRLKPNYAEAHLELALTLSDLGDHEGAEKSCRNALRIQPNYQLAKQALAAELCALGRAQEAEKLLRAQLALGVRNPQQEAAFEHNLAVALIEQRRFPEALSLLSSAQAKVPDMASADYNRGNALQQLGRLEEAVVAYRDAVARNPLDMGAHKELNELLYRLGKREEFLKSYDDAAALYPEFAPLPLQKANYLHLKGDFAGARDAFERAAFLKPESVAPHDGLALVLARLGEFPRALIEHEIAIRVGAEHSAVWRNYAQTLLSAGDPEAAKSAAERAVSLEPESQIALAVWGLALRVLGDPLEERINDVENLVRVYEIPTPDGYASIADFHGELNQFLDGMHWDRSEAIDQTLRGGTQTLDDLFGMGHPPIELLRSCIDKAVSDYVDRMPQDETHPLFRRRQGEFRYSASWSSRLRDCGYHTNHVHSKGWISSAYYVALPDAVEKTGSREGWIKFGEPNLPFGIADAVRRTVQPHAGMLVLFPSYMWHGTVPFHSAQSRTTIAFDVVPKE